MESQEPKEDWMRLKHFFPVLLGLVLTLGVSAVAFSQDGDPSNPPAEVEFKRPEGAAATNYAGVKFNHEAHMAEDCMLCHHTWDGASNVKSCSAKGCHDDMKNRELPTSYFRAYHDKHSKRSCVGCHTEMNAEAKKKGEEMMKISPCANNMCHVKS